MNANLSGRSLGPVSEPGMPRAEYPRPQMVREEWMCLNGEWQFEVDPGNSGFERGWVDRELADRILVPFCPESILSGVHNTDFLNAVWYRREIEIPAEWDGRDIHLHFQAVDYDATVWVNGKEIGRHRGGFTPFTVDLTGVACPGQRATVVLRAQDTADHPQPRGKQSQKFGRHGCLYDRTTGIWQTVWMEPVSHWNLGRPRITPDLSRGGFLLEQPLSRMAEGLYLKVTLSDGDRVVCTARVAADRDFCPSLFLAIPDDRRRLWSPGDPFLYDVEIELTDRHGATLDRVRSYAGLRSVQIQGRAVLINGDAVFQRLVLDQGYYPDGLMTAPTDQALINDILLAQHVGFNGARLHQKVFEERFLYHADRLGYLVWAEFPDWGCGGFGPDGDHQRPTLSYVGEWIEAVTRDYSHPSIIGWCPLNETHQAMTDRTTVLDDATKALFLATKALDRTRPVIDASGYSHRVVLTDIYDSHDYDQNPVTFRARHAALAEGKAFTNTGKSPHATDGSTVPWSVGYRAQPYFVSEFGGIWWNPDARPDEDSWGYGTRPRSIEEFYARFEGLVGALLENEHMFGYCYTQLTDVFQEQNGIYLFDRTPKFDPDRLRRVQSQVAAIERKWRTELALPSTVGSDPVALPSSAALEPHSSA